MARGPFSDWGRFARSIQGGEGASSVSFSVQGILDRSLDGPKHWRKTLSQLFVRLRKQHNNVTGLGKRGHDAGTKDEHITSQDRLHVLTIQPDDQVLSIFVVKSNSFYGHDWSLAHLCRTPVFLSI